LRGFGKIRTADSFSPQRRRELAEMRREKKGQRDGEKEQKRDKEFLPLSLSLRLSFFSA
jgi:hypothetical protein